MKALLLGAPAVLGGAHHLAVYAAYLVEALHPPTKFAAIPSSYGCGGEAIKQSKEILGQLKVEVVGAYEINGFPAEECMKQITEFGREVVEKIKKKSDKGSHLL